MRNSGVDKCEGEELSSAFLPDLNFFDEFSVLTSHSHLGTFSVILASPSFFLSSSLSSFFSSFFFLIVLRNWDLLEGHSAKIVQMEYL